MADKPLLIFDFDGTLADSISVGLDVANKLSGLFGYKAVHDLNLIRESSAVKFVFSQLAWYKLPLWIYLMKRGIKKRQDEICLFEGAAKLLHDLKQKYRIGLIGGGRPDYHAAILQRHNADIFDFRIGNQGTRKHKTITKILKSNYEQENCYYIGDDRQDVISAKIAGIKSIAVSWGGTSKETLLAAKPTVLVESIEELRKQLLG